MSRRTSHCASSANTVRRLCSIACACWRWRWRTSLAVFTRVLKAAWSSGLGFFLSRPMVHGPTSAGSASPSCSISTAQPSSSSFLITRAVQPSSCQRRSLRSAAGWSAWEGRVGSWSSRVMSEASGFMGMLALLAPSCAPPLTVAATAGQGLAGCEGAVAAPGPAATEAGAGTARGSDSAAGSSASGKAMLAADRRRGGFARSSAAGGGPPAAANRGIWSCVIFSLAQWM